MKTLAIAFSSKLPKLLEEIVCDKEDAIYAIEVWDRNPAIFSKEQTVHPLYLLRYFKHTEDERTQEALKTIEARYKGL